ncbi:FACT complex subunit like [Actinidia chinensis var. chinensis]|uniref:FACT complex subunit n=1 Tax=Actinidia chinensis var. chinensis TaxID=1590841 RepID=A0A2R6RJB0_ACTCC|nr:FACT complex subunit like [Actinidia chinensis var. chinensis]
MNLKLFKKRLISFYLCWRKHKRDLWGGSDVLAICTLPSDAVAHPISSSFFVWLLGHDFPDTVAVFSRNEIYFLCTRRKFSALQSLVGPAREAVQAKVTVYFLGGDRLEQMDRIIRGMQIAHKAKADSDENRPFVVGYISGESPKSKLLWSCYNNMKPNEFLGAHVSGFSRLLNHDQNGRYSRKSRERYPELFEVQMQSLPQEFEQMLAMTPERRSPKAPSEADAKKVQLDNVKEYPTVIIDDESEKYLHPKDVEGSSNEGALGCDEEDEWVLVEADSKEQYMGKRDGKGKTMETIDGFRSNTS